MAFKPRDGRKSSRPGSDALRTECDAEGKRELFEKTQPWLIGESAYGDQAIPAEALGLSPDAMSAWVAAAWA